MERPNGPCHQKDAQEEAPTGMQRGRQTSAALCALPASASVRAAAAGSPVAQEAGVTTSPHRTPVCPLYPYLAILAHAVSHRRWGSAATTPCPWPPAPVPGASGHHGSAETGASTADEHCRG